jgi:hypothetical protein
MGAAQGWSAYWPLVRACKYRRGRLSFDRRSKSVVFARDDTGVSGQIINANDNVAFVAANDNAVVAVRAAA